MSDNIEVKQDVKEQEAKLNLFQKLVKVREQVIYIQKTAKGQFSYAPSAAIIAALREEMDRQNLLLVPNMEGFSIIEVQGAKNACAKIELSYTWIDADSPSDRLTTNYTYLDQKAGICQGVGSVLTYAERYFLCKFFQIATDEQDPDAFMRLHDLSIDEEESVPPGIDSKLKEIIQDHSPMTIYEAVTKIKECMDLESPQKLGKYLQYCIDKIDIPLSVFVERLLKNQERFASVYRNWLVKNHGIAA